MPGASPQHQQAASLPGLPSPSWEVSSGFQRPAVRPQDMDRQAWDLLRDRDHAGLAPVPHWADTREQMRRPSTPKSSSGLRQLPTQTPSPHSLIPPSPHLPLHHCRSPVSVLPACLCLLPPPTPEAWHLPTRTPLRRPSARAQDLCVLRSCDHYSDLILHGLPLALVMGTALLSNSGIMRTLLYNV